MYGLISAIGENHVIDLWKTLGLNVRSHLVAIIDKSQLEELMQILDMKERSVLLSIVSAECGEELIDKLKPEEKQEFFFFQNFNTEQQTKMDSKEFVERLHNQFFEKTNDKIPFAKMEDGYVQCILNPDVPKGFITVQLCKPGYTTKNT